MCDVWYRSIYWRILFGFSAFLAIMLVAQGLILAWLANDMADLRRLGLVSGVMIGLGTALVATV